MDEESPKQLYFMANFHYGMLRRCLGHKEVEALKGSRDSWEEVTNEEFVRLFTMYRAGERDLRKKITEVL